MKARADTRLQRRDGPSKRSKAPAHPWVPPVSNETRVEVDYAMPLRPFEVEVWNTP
jgi:hypothetical protein